MSRAKPYRSKPTRDFMIYYDIALQSRYYLVQENGPTKMTLEASNKKKYKISVGSEISCSCGGGRTEHCVHTIYALIKIFRIPEGDPLIWQLAFTDTELEKILEVREKNLLRNRGSYEAWRSHAGGIDGQYRDAMAALRRDEGYRDRNAQLNLIQNPPDIMGDADPRRQNRTGINIGNGGIRIGGGASNKGNWADNAKDNRPIVPPRPLEDEEMCCVCCDTLRENEDLSHCRYGCGRQIHTDCLMRCFKHNQSNGKPLNCPLCRTNWGPMGVEVLKENTKAWRAKKQEQATANKSMGVAQIVNGALKETSGGSAAAAATKQGSKIGGGAAERGFKCASCKRQLMYEGKYQCMVCADTAICKLCFGVKYHEQHEFLTRPQPDRDWEPAFRNQNPAAYNEEYKKVMEQLQNSDRELGPEDYDLLLSLENKQNIISLPRFLAMGFEKIFKPPQSYFDIPKAYCAFCEAEIVDRQTGLQLKNCNHHVHKTCLQDIFTLKNSCPLCDQKILDGYEVCLNTPKIVNKVTKVIAKKPKKNTSLDQNLNMELQRQAEQNIALQFGIAGSNFNSMGVIEETKESAVGRRDIFKIPGSTPRNGQQANVRGALRNAPGRPPLQNRRPVPRPQEEEKKAPSSFAAAGFAGDFNLAGTQLGGTPLTTTTKESTQMGSEGRRQSRMALGKRPQSLNTRFQSAEEEKKQPFQGGPIELNATGLGRGRRIGAAVSAHGPITNKHRLTRDMQQYEDFDRDDDDDLLDQMQEKLASNLRDKKVKEAIVKRQKEQGLAKAKKLGNNAPLAKYYREQIQANDLTLNATGLQAALQTGSPILQDNAMRITGGLNSNSKKPTIARGLQGVGRGGGAREQPLNQQQIRVGSGNRATRKQWNSDSRKQISNLRPPRQNSQAHNPSQFNDFIGDNFQPQVRPLANNRAAAQPIHGLANCALISGAIATNDPVFADGIRSGGVNTVHAKVDLGIFGAQVER